MFDFQEIFSTDIDFKYAEKLTNEQIGKIICKKFDIAVAKAWKEE